VVSLSLINSAN